MSMFLSQGSFICLCRVYKPLKKLPPPSQRAKTPSLRLPRAESEHRKGLQVWVNTNYLEIEPACICFCGLAGWKLILRQNKFIRQPLPQVTPITCVVEVKKKSKSFLNFSLGWRNFPMCKATSIHPSLFEPRVSWKNLITGDSNAVCVTSKRCRYSSDSSY